MSLLQSPFIKTYCISSGMLNFFKKRFRKSAEHDGLNSRIRWVAEVIDNGAQFKERAQQAALELDPGAIDSLAGWLHGEHTPPKELEEKFPRLGQWIAARQFAIFEMLYQRGEDALPVLRRIAFGEYDWTQGNAIEVLCRLAAQGVDQSKIIEDLKAHLGSIREEAHKYALGPLLHYAGQDPGVKAVLDQLLTVAEFRESYDHLLSHRSDA
jgi:hypothetical protein